MIDRSIALRKRVLIVGCGDIGTRLGQRLRDAGTCVTGVCRSADRAATLEAQGIRPVRADLDDILTLRALDTDDTVVFYLVPPQPHGENDLRVRCFLGTIPARRAPHRIVLLSTTSVYGDRQGGWVDEREPPRPATPRARRRLDAERVARAYGRAHGIAVVVLRVAGIYAADRLPVERLTRAEPLVRVEQSPFTNRIHAEDLVTVLMAAAQRGRPDEIYNVSDGEPLRMTEYFFAVADALGLERPPTCDLTQAARRLSPAMLSYLSESRRLCNRKMLNELGVRLKFASLQAGLGDARATRAAPSH